jgi:hypothetical protein
MYNFEHFKRGKDEGSYYRTLEICQSEHDLLGKLVSHFHDVPNGPINVTKIDPLGLPHLKGERQ